MMTVITEVSLREGTEPEWDEALSSTLNTPGVALPTPAPRSGALEK